jgi:hypothetical protein
MSAALEIFNEQGTWRRECVHVNTESVFEASAIAVTMAVGLINLAWTEESGTDRVHILSMNQGFASSVVKIRLEPEPNRVPGELSLELEKLHGNIRVISRYFNKDISLRNMEDTHVEKRHMQDQVLLKSSVRREEKGNISPTRAR